MGRGVELRFRWTPAIIGLLYLVLLITPWILTCEWLNGTRHDLKWRAGMPLTAITEKDVLNRNRGAHAIRALNVLTALVALPVIYALLASAAVVWSQRTGAGNKLNAAQLFSLADARFLQDVFPGRPASLLTYLGASLVLLALALPIVRSVLVSPTTSIAPEAVSEDVDWWDSPRGWNATLLALDASPQVLAQHLRANPPLLRTRQDLIGSHPNEWLRLAPRDPQTNQIFASAIAPDTATGMLRQHALRMHSSVVCDSSQRLADPQYPKSCGGDEFTYNAPGMDARVCLRSYREGTNLWKAGVAKQDLTEELYAQVIPNAEGVTNEDWETLYAREIHCVVNTTLGYFELPNLRNGNKPGPLKTQTWAEHEFDDIAGSE